MNFVRMSQSESHRVAHIHVEIRVKKKKKKKKDFESLVLRKFRKITAISHPCVLSLEKLNGQDKMSTSSHQQDKSQ